MVVRENEEDGIQVLLLKRNKTLAFAPDFWVFPGGRVDQEDGPFIQSAMENTAGIAAAREAREEAGLILDPALFQHFCHWTTPEGDTRRYGTWFFHTLIEKEQSNVTIDQHEIIDFKWIHPAEALRLLNEGQLNFLPPTLITLNRIKRASTYKEVQSEFKRTGVIKVAPVTRLHEGRFYCMYDGDSGYESGNINLRDQLHRLIIDQKNREFHFEYENCPVSPPVHGGIAL